MATFWIEGNVLRAKNLIPGSISDSIVKWVALRNLVKSGHLVSDGGSRTCALCLKYTDCVNCPISIHTGKRSCLDTPYAHYCRACLYLDSEMAQGAAEAMIEFLEELEEE